MNRYGLAKLIIIIAALNLYGCGGAAERPNNGGKSDDAAADAAPSPAPTANVAAAAADTAPAPTATDEVAASRRSASRSSGPGGGPPSKAPTPQIGSGGNDLFLFTKARAAVNADPELKAANLIIEVKEGVILLSGAVTSPALKARAEELARGAGPKAVRNQLRVAAGK
jgi:osmotically-inducible protein OsmY